MINHCGPKKYPKELSRAAVVLGGGGGGVCSPRVKDGHRWVFRDSLSKVFHIIYTFMSEAFITYKSDVCLDCIVYYSLLFIFIILHKLVHLDLN